MENNKVWSQHGNSFYISDISTHKKQLELGVYLLTVDEKQIINLSRINDKFPFNFKVYGIEDEFIKRVIKTWKHTKSNLGILLNGIQGTGKTVTGEIIANSVELPIIVVSKPYKGITEYISSIEQDAVIFIDEYEKIFKGSRDEGDDESESDASLLSIMDGAIKTNHRKLFILTTNNPWVNTNMVNRPGRIRYKKEFNDLSLEQIKEIINDILEHKQYTEDIINFLKPLAIITVDIVKSIVQEVNIHNEPPDVCCKDFNASTKDETYTVIKIGHNEQPIDEEVTPKNMERFTYRMRTNPITAILYTNGSNSTLKGVEDQPHVNEGIYIVTQIGTPQPFKIRFQKNKFLHSVFTF